MNSYDYTIPKKRNKETSIFLIKGRITRKIYFLRLLLCTGIYAEIALLYIYRFSADGSNWLSTDFGQFLFIYVPLLLVAFIFIQRIKRMHDLNRSGWDSIIPFLVFQKGDNGDNDYGIDPVKKPVEFFDQLDEYHEKNNDDAIERKRKRATYLSVLIVLIIAAAAFIPRPDSTAKTTPAPVSSDRIPGLYLAKQMVNPESGVTMYAEIVKKTETDFNIRLLSEFGKKICTFTRNEDGTLTSAELGSGTVSCDSLEIFRKIVIVFSDKNGSKWEFSKSK